MVETTAGVNEAPGGRVFDDLIQQEFAALPGC